MISLLAKGDYEDMLADGLKPTLEDFDRLNQIALRLTDGAETTAANFPRVGWAGDVPFFQPTCAAFAWYLQFVERADFDNATKDACWFYALHNARSAKAFACVAQDDIVSSVNAWLSTLPVTRDEIARACRFAATGFDDAVAAKPNGVKRNTSDDNLSALNENITVTSALTGVAPSALETETPSRLAAMVEAVHENANGEIKPNLSKLRADYDLTYREIRMRLLADRANDLSDASANGTDGLRYSVDDDGGHDARPDYGEQKPAGKSSHGESIAK